MVWSKRNQTQMSMYYIMSFMKNTRTGKTLRYGDRNQDSSYLWVGTAVDWKGAPGNFLE